MSHHSPARFRALFAFAGLLAMHNAGAAVVFNETAITGDTNVYNNGTLITANNLGGGGAVTVNGVNFGTDYSGLGGNYQNTSSASYSTDPFSTELNTVLQSHVIDTVWYNSAFEYANSLSIGGLTIGNDYRVQILMSRDGSNWDSDFILEGVSYLIESWMPNAINLSAAWTATDSTMNLTIGKSSGVAYEGYTVVSGYALHDVTGVEAFPSVGATSVDIGSSLTLTALGMTGLFVRRRRRS